ncbi:hypothetical protein ATANTOWER_005601 [Ataeniobius toweri]|uniref:Secreted protein n=1 Tax=Ataeniobius toweri TaxID=208326 RepID=A0ABU7BDY8_9TELE|nr:hypothetical protein [Ataeniobius toweri]
MSPWVTRSAWIKLSVLHTCAAATGYLSPSDRLRCASAVFIEKTRTEAGIQHISVSCWAFFPRGAGVVNSPHHQNDSVYFIQCVDITKSQGHFHLPPSNHQRHPLQPIHVQLFFSLTHTFVLSLMPLFLRMSKKKTPEQIQLRRVPRSHSSLSHISVPLQFQSSVTTLQ